MSVSRGEGVLALGAGVAVRSRRTRKGKAPGRSAATGTEQTPPDNQKPDGGGGGRSGPCGSSSGPQRCCWEVAVGVPALGCTKTQPPARVPGAGERLW